ncbi:MAG: GntR family transcriptional regulator / MocR family aminotransferase [bacterium]|jgi:GntR family transcriptional regulator/MocR family aminotransferase
MIGPVELYLDLERHAGAPLRRRLEREIREAVRTGRLTPGTALPSTRALAAQLGVSRGVVVESYTQLVAEGWLSARQGAATVVAARAGAGVERRASQAISEPSLAPRYDFRYGSPDLSAFPRAAWLAASARTLRALPDARLGYGDARGAIELREALAAYLGRVRGVVADPGLMLVGSGTRHGLGLVWRVLREAGARRVAIEDPGWSAQRETALGAGLEPVPVGVDERGMCVGELEALDVDAVTLTPAHQCPTGAVLAPERRAALLDWARRREALVVEDDYDAEYRYDREPVGALQAMAPERVVYAGSASKTLAPGLRIGWLVLPDRLMAPATRQRVEADRGGPLLDQLTLADLVARGELDRHLRRTRRSYRARRDALLAAVAAELPGGRVEGIAAGLHAVVRLPSGCDEAATVAAAAGRGIALDGLASFFSSGTSPHPALVLGYANLAEPAIARGIGELARALR